MPAEFVRILNSPLPHPHRKKGFGHLLKNVAIVNHIHCDNIMGVAWVYWIIYSRGVVQYIQRREAPRDILLNPEGVYSPIYPCHAHYITIVIGKNKSAIALVIF